MVSNKNYVPKIYLQIHEKLKEECINDILEKKQMNIIIGRCFIDGTKYPKEVVDGMIKGLEKHDLILVLDKFKVKIN